MKTKAQRYFFHTASSAALILCMSACTQQPAEVVMNGSNSYGKRGPVTGASGVYSQVATAAPVTSVSSSDDNRSAAAAPVYSSSNTVSNASGVSVSDLPPPSANGTVAPVSKVASAPVTASNSAARVPANSPFGPSSPPLETASEDAVTAKSASGSVNLWTKEPHFSNQPASNEAALNPSAGKAPQPAAALLSQKVAAASGANYMWPVSSKKVITSFGPKAGGRVSDGIDIASAEGEPVWAASDGEIVFVGDELKGYGNMVLIKHTDGKTSTYAHLSRAAVDKYDRVKQGDIIGYVGTTGNVRDPQLFFAINDGKTPVDPQKYLSRNVAGL